MKLFAFLALLGVLSLFADLHAEEYASPAKEECCVSCCPAHHLAPTPVVTSVENIPLPVGYISPLISCVSIDPSDALFRPPRGV